MKKSRILSAMLAVVLAFTTLFSGGVFFTGDMGEVEAARPTGSLWNNYENGIDGLIEAAQGQAKESGIGVTTGSSTWTVAVYMCGTDLEAPDNGMAGTRDLLEMIDAKIPGNVNLIVMTGGTADWSDEVIKWIYDGRNESGSDEQKYYNWLDKQYHYLEKDIDIYLGDMTIDEDGNVTTDRLKDYKTQLWQITDDKMVELVPNLDVECDLSDPKTVTDFLNFAQKYAPADHFFVDFWDHGGGPIGGAECAQYNDGTVDDPKTGRSSAMTMPEIEGALAAALEGGRSTSAEVVYKYDMIGFDCCLMGSIEVAYGLKDYADYLLASQETEPGTGWNYRWLNVFNDDNGTTPIEVGEAAINLFSNGIGDEDKNDKIESLKLWEGTEFEGSTLALMDLDEEKMSNAASIINELGGQLSSFIDKGEKDSDYMWYFVYLTRQLAELHSMLDGEIGLVDSYKFAKSISDSAKDLTKGIAEEDLTDADKDLMEIGETADQLIKVLGASEDVEYEDGNPKGQVGNIGDGESGVVLYRALASDYAGGNGLTIFYPGFTNLGKAYQIAALETTTGGVIKAPYSTLKFSKEAKDYAEFLRTMLTKDIYSYGNEDTFLNAYFDYDKQSIVIEPDKVHNFDKLMGAEAYVSTVKDKTETIYGMLYMKRGYDSKTYKTQDFTLDMSKVEWYYTQKEGSSEKEYFTYELDTEGNFMVPGFMRTANDDRHSIPAAGPISMTNDAVKTMVYLICDKDGKITDIYDADENGSYTRVDFGIRKSDIEFAPVQVTQEVANTDEDKWTYVVRNPQTIYKGGTTEYKLNVKRISAEDASDAVRVSCYASDLLNKVYTTQEPINLVSGKDDSGSRPSSSGGSGGSVGSNSTTKTVKNADGSTTTTMTTKTANSTITIVTTKHSDGSVEKKKTVENKDGSKVVTETTINTAGTEKVVEVATDKDGNVTSVTTSVTNKKGVGMSASYTASGSKLTLKSVETKGKSAVTIPATVKCDGKTYKVTKIGAGALKGNKDVKTLTVGKNVTSIGKNAFNGASKLKTVTIKGKVTSVGKNAFSGINKKAIIKIETSKKNYKKIKKVIKKSGVSQSVRYKRV